MEPIKKRESTLEVLRRLQAQNAMSIPEMYKKAPVILRVEDVLDRDRLERLNPQKSRIIPTGKPAEGIMILNEIKNTEKQLRSGKSYFDVYYELRKKEDKLVNFYDNTQDKENLPEEVIRKVKEIKNKLSKL